MYNKIFATVVAVLICLSTNVASANVGVGCDRVEKKALEFALADLSAQVRVQVESEILITSTVQNDQRKDRMQHNIRTYTDLPIFSYNSSYDGKCAKVYFDNNAKEAYLSAIIDLTLTVNQYVKKSKDEPNDRVKLSLLGLAYTDYERLERLSAVARFLHVDNVPYPVVAKADILSQMARMRLVSGDMEQVAKNIADTIPTGEYTVDMVKTLDSYSTTEFSHLLAKQLQNKVKNTKGSPEYRLSCYYSTTGDPFIVSCDVLGGGQLNVATTAVTFVDKKLCSNIDCITPIKVPMVSSGVVGFTQHFYTNYGSDHQVMTEGDVVTVYARVSRPVVAVMVNRSNGGDQIIPINGKRSLYISAINSEVELLKLKATPPYGDDSLILVTIRADENTRNDLISYINGIEGGGDTVNGLKSKYKERYGESALSFHVVPNVKQ